MTSSDPQIEFMIFSEKNIDAHNETIPITMNALPRNAAHRVRLSMRLLLLRCLHATLDLENCQAFQQQIIQATTN